MLKTCEINATIAREELILRITEFYDKQRKRRNYQDLPYLWFIVTFFENTVQLLRVADFHASHFYEYLMRALRNNGEVMGVFALIKENIPLESAKWENLQEFCVKIYPPLKQNELDILNSIYTYISNSSYLSLDRKALKNHLDEKMTYSHNYKELANLFTRIGSNWYLWHHLKSYDLKEFGFRVRLADSVQLNEIID